MPPLQHACSNFQVKSEVVVPKRADPRRRDPRVKEARIVTIEPPPSDPSNKEDLFKKNKTKSSSVPPKSSSPAPKSPGRKSEPREAPPPSAKSATPPPAPSIREDFKGKFKDSPLRPAASKKKSGGFEAALAAANSKQPREK